MKKLIPLFFMIFLSFPLIVNAQICRIYTGIPPTPPGPNMQKLLDILNVIVNFLMIIGVAGGVLVIIVGGIKYMTAGGNESNVSSAKKLIIYGILGFIIIIAAQFIICLVAELLANLYTS